MRTIELDDDTYLTLAVAARAARCSPGEIVAMALETFGAHAAGESAPPPDDTAADVGIHATYLRRPVAARFNRVTHAVVVTSPPLENQVFSSPSAAARAVVMAINPERENVGVNGWRFWRVTKTRKMLDTLR